MARAPHPDDKIVESVTKDGAHYSWIFWCPGCADAHSVTSGWEWNGSTSAPTFEPSIRMRWNEGEKRTPRCCHSFVRDGRIQFLADCTHALAGKTVEIPAWPGWDGPPGE